MGPGLCGSDNERTNTKTGSDDPKIISRNGERPFSGARVSRQGEILCDEPMLNSRRNVNKRVGTAGMPVAQTLPRSHSEVEVHVAAAPALGAHAVPGALCPLGWEEICLMKQQMRRQGRSRTRVLPPPDTGSDFPLNLQMVERKGNWATRWMGPGRADFCPLLCPDLVMSVVFIGSKYISSKTLRF